MNRISLKHGSEGPKHDPYAYTEITVEGRNGKTMIHRGLAYFVEYAGRRFEGDEAQVDKAFEQATGLTPRTAERSHDLATYRRIKTHLKRCRSHLAEQDGMPGESFTCCAKCGEVLDVHFDRRAIE